MQVVALYFLVATTIVMIVMVTPTQAEYVKGLLRAHKQGLVQLSAWDDLSLNRVFLAAVCAILLVTGTVIWRAGIGSPVALPPDAIRNFPLGIAMGVLVVGYFGLGMQYFLLRFGSRGKMYFGLFLFLAWVLPMIAGTIFMMTSMPRDTSQAAQVIYSVSPIAGIAMSSVGENPNGANFSKVLQGAAITPALFFAFIFNTLLINARRRLHREFLARAEIAKIKAAHAARFFTGTRRDLIRSPPY